MNRELPRQRQWLYGAERLVLRHVLDARGALEATSLLLLLGFAIWMLLPRSWEDVAGRSIIQFGLLTLVTFLSAVVLVRAALSLPLPVASLSRVADWLSPRRLLIAFILSMAG